MVPGGSEADGGAPLPEIAPKMKIASGSSQPGVSIADIATAAGAGRITLYSHCKTRAESIDAVLGRVIEQVDEVLNTTDTTGDPRHRPWAACHRRGRS